MSEKLLLHICCAPCATAVVEELRNEGFEVTGFFYNPSIHPWKEFQRRLGALKDWAPTVDLPVVYFEEYPLEENLEMLLNADNRCRTCFEDRLLATALSAKELGIERFTTTLAVSPYQNQNFLSDAGNKAFQATGTEYLERDFRKSYRSTIEKARSVGLYRQPYCGCVFSERDRYLKIKSPGETH